MAEEHFAALRPRRSNIITPEISPFRSPSPFPTTDCAGVQVTLVVLKEVRGWAGGEFSGVMILLRRGWSAAKCFSTIHYSYIFLTA